MTYFQADQPFNRLPLLPPKGDIETKAVLKKCIEARSQLAALQQAGALIPNPTMLVNLLPILEAKDSSEIENLVTTTDDLFRFSQIHESQADAHTKETLRYRTALYEGCQWIETEAFSVDIALKVCSIIKGDQVLLRDREGTKLIGELSQKIIYTPPEGRDRIHLQLDNWAEYLNASSSVDPLIRMAVAHYQFEAIHPFHDGNGRTGRVLNLMFLVREQLLSIPILYLSRYIIEHRGDYYRLLLQVSKTRSWEAWILYMLDAIETTARWTSEKISRIKRLFDDITVLIRQQLPNVYSRELVEVIFNQPYCRIKNLVDMGIAQRQAASDYLKALVDLGVLQEMKVGREKLFLNMKLLSLLREPH